MTFHLSEILLAGFEPLDQARRAPVASEELEHALEEAVRAAHAAWPTVTLPVEELVRRMAVCLSWGDDPAKAVRSIHAGDLLLASACAHGDAHALEGFEARFFSEVDRTLARMNVAASAIDEAKQVLRHRFFVTGKGASPKITEYSGAGPLRAWVRAAAVRAALRVVRQPKGQAATDDATLLAITSPSSDLELVYLKKLYAGEARQALRDSFAALGVRDRNLLRQHFALGLGVDEIGRCYQVHRATAARWVVRAREALVEKMREAMMQRLKLRRDEVSSILRLTRSQIAEGLRGLLLEAGEIPG